MIKYSIFLNKILVFIIIIFMFSAEITFSQNNSCSDGIIPQSTQTAPGEIQENPDFTLHPLDTPQTVEPGSCFVIVFSGGARPFDIQVTGTGFYLDETPSLTFINDFPGNKIKVCTDSGACGTAIIIITAANGKSTKKTVMSNVGRWADSILVDLQTAADICGSSGVNYPRCSTGSNGNDICQGIPGFRYSYYSCGSFSAGGIEPPGCTNGICGTCNNKNQACCFTFSDGICTATKKRSDSKGWYWMALYRSDWVCPDQ